MSKKSELSYHRDIDRIVCRVNGIDHVLAIIDSGPTVNGRFIRVTPPLFAAPVPSDEAVKQANWILDEYKAGRGAGTAAVDCAREILRLKGE